MSTIDSRVSAGLNDADVIHLWLHRQQSPLTRSAYARDIRRLLTWSGKRLPQITALDLERFASSLDESGLAIISQGRTLAAARSLFRFAERIGYCANAAGGLDLPHNDNHIVDRLISEADVRRMIEAEPDQRNRLLLMCLYSSGLRVSEACALRWRDLQRRDDSGQLTVVGRGRRTRSVTLSSKIWKQLSELGIAAKPTDPVFASRSGKRLDRSRVWRIVKEASARVGLDSGVTTHWLRHTHASHALDRGAPMHLVQATLGHASIATTSRYLHARTRRVEQQLFAILSLFPMVSHSPAKTGPRSCGATAAPRTD